MKNFVLIHIIIGLFAIGAPYAAASYSEELDQVLKRLNTAIANTETVDKQRMVAIDSLKAKSLLITDPEAKYNVNRRIFRHYESFICDSALEYINRNVALARSMGNEHYLIESLLAKCSLLSKGGLYISAIELLDSIPTERIPRNMLDEYYHCNFDIYQYLSEYTEGTDYKDFYAAKSNAYCDSTLSVANDNSFIYQSLMASRLSHIGELDQAKRYTREVMRQYKLGSRQYSILASLMAYNAKLRGVHDEAELWNALSALSDVEGSVKENMSLRQLAECMMEDGKVTEANLYLKKSIDDAAFFSSRLRGQQSAALLPVIDQAYEAFNNRSKARQRLFFAITAVLALAALVLSVLLFRQMRRVSASNSELRAASREMTQLNNDLRQLNSAAVVINRNLAEANRIKEVCLRSFMELSSTALNQLDHMRTTVSNKIKSGKTEELKRILTSQQAVNDSVREFYATFDHTFLSIFPTFVSDINTLFPEEEHFDEDHGGRLTNELRIIALIRMGINDNQRISMFLRCSLSTVYTYRSRLRSRALKSDTLINDILAIGAV